MTKNSAVLMSNRIQLSSNDESNIKKITTVIDRFLSTKFDDTELLRYGVKEEAISHRLGCYLRDIFEGENKPCVVDCEYNKFGEGKGKVVEGKNIRPDIIIHQRGNQNYNLMAIEVKKRLTPKQWDETKLKRLTSISSCANTLALLGFEVF
jgi:hypothetical protein